MPHGRGEQSRSNPLFKPKSRHVKPLTRLFLYVQAGGRCEFDGCNKFLLEHYPTETIGNYAEMAHVWAFSEGGPRGKSAGRPSRRQLNELSNLILLCPACHKTVDDYPDEYPVEVLKSFKRDHEDRVYDLTDIGKDRDTVPLVVKGRIAGRAMQISDEEMQLAVAPNYIKRRQRVEIDLTQIPDSAAKSYWTTACSAIDRKLHQLDDTPSRNGRALKVSVFALARIPLLIYIGSRLSDKLTVDLYQRHRSPESWAWKSGEGEARYTTRSLVDGADAEEVALLVNLSGANPTESLPANLAAMPTYEITLAGSEPNQLFLNCRGDLQRFKEEFIRTMAMIRTRHPAVNRIHLFPAVPAPVAIIMGRERLPNADPPFIIYDRDRDAAGFISTLEVK